jgi:hypothetical protein
MRLVRLICFLMFAAAFQLGLAQTQSEQIPFQERTKVQLYPNPTLPQSEYLHVKFEETIPAEKVAVSLHNIIGNKMEVETEIVDKHEIRVRIKDLASGYYLIALKDEETNFRGIYKFLKR